MVHPQWPVGDADVRFLAGERIRSEIERLVGLGTDLRVAVAYWGDGGACHTGVTKRDKAARGNVRILCDLRSGACNPSEIQQLQQSGVAVRTLDRLHAKAWIGESTVIVGSANASTSGLADETQLGSNVEAALLVENRKLAEDLRRWFDTKWCSGAARDINEECLHSAKKLWKKRRKFARKASQKPLTGPSTLDVAALKKRLINNVASTGLRLWSVDQSPDITLRSVRKCQEDQAWMRDYGVYLQSGQGCSAERRGELHREFGRNVKRLLGARSGKSGVKPRQPKQNDLLGSYTELHAE